MAKNVAIGIQSFDKIIEGNYFYIDKTFFIKDWWESGDDVTLITRPRRFGKTLNMSMVEHTGEENVVNDELREIHRMVDAVKKDEEVSKNYMKVYEKEQMLLRQGREEGRQEGIKGELIKSVEKLMRKKAYTLQQACDLLDYSVEDYHNAKKMIEKV